MCLSFCRFCVVVLWILRIASSEYAGVCNNEICSASNSSLENGTSSRVLSRSKRFLIFPDGSSLQLVFCVQTAALIPIGDIFLYGQTAALAWTLPSDPKTLLKVKDESPLRRSDIMSVKYINENGNIVASVPYKRPHIVNPAFAKRSVDDKMTYKERIKIKFDRGKMHERQSTRDYLNTHHLDDSLDFHRLSRAQLYYKLESLISALGGDGRQCVLYKLCQSAQSAASQGTFLQELLRVVFTCSLGGPLLHRHGSGSLAICLEKRMLLADNVKSTTLPKGKKFNLEEHQDYDLAHMKVDNCSRLYPGCENFTGYM